VSEGGGEGGGGGGGSGEGVSLGGGVGGDVSLPPPPPPPPPPSEESANDPNDKTTVGEQAAADQTPGAPKLAPAGKATTPTDPAQAIGQQATADQVAADQTAGTPKLAPAGKATPPTDPARSIGQLQMDDQTPSTPKLAPAGQATSPVKETAARATAKRPDPPVRKLSAQELAERRSFDRPAHGVGFGFNKEQPAMGEMERLMATLKAEMGDLRGDPMAVIKVETWASRPGTESYNLKLTQQRADVLEKLLRQHGFTGTIVKIAHGEAPREPEHAPMALDQPKPVDRGKADAQDDAANRVAIVTVEAVGTSIDFEPEVVPSDREEMRQLDEATKSGKKTFTSIASITGEQIRDLIPVPDNPLGEEPSGDPQEFLRQAGEKVKEVLEDLVSGPKAPEKVAKLLGKYTLGPLFEGVVRENWKAEVAAKRMPLYAAYADGAAGAIDPKFSRTTFSDPLQQRMSDAAYEAFSRLSETDKENVTKYLVENVRRGTTAAVTEGTSAQWVASHSDRGIDSAIRIWFQDDHYQRD
jgi:outer membrane protein OmpA-like peptidoglycan-associated protein